MLPDSGTVQGLSVAGDFLPHRMVAPALSVLDVGCAGGGAVLSPSPPSRAPDSHSPAILDCLTQCDSFVQDKQLFQFFPT